MDFILALWPYVLAAVTGCTVGLAVYHKFGVAGLKSAFKGMVAGTHAAKQKLDELGIDYKANLTTLIDAHVTDPKAKKLLNSVIEIVEREASASASEDPSDAGPAN